MPTLHHVQKREARSSASRTDSHLPPNSARAAALLADPSVVPPIGAARERSIKTRSAAHRTPPLASALVQCDTASAPRVLRVGRSLLWYQPRVRALFLFALLDGAEPGPSCARRAR